MNCKPGDLAIVVRTKTVAHRWLIGRIVRVVRLDADNFWELEQPIPLSNVDLYAIADDNLRPIRPHGVTDEEVRDLYAPKVPEVV
jgi:hypothetical protein